MRSLFAALALFIAVQSCSNAVDEGRGIGSVSGRVLLEDTEFSIPKVEVKLGEYSFKTVTNGEFSFKGVSAGVYRISAFKSGYNLHSDSIEVSGSTEYEIRLFRLDTPR